MITNLKRIFSIVLILFVGSHLQARATALNEEQLWLDSRFRMFNQQFGMNGFQNLRSRQAINSPGFQDLLYYIWTCQTLNRYPSLNANPNLISSGYTGFLKENKGNLVAAPSIGFVLDGSVNLGGTHSFPQNNIADVVSGIISGSGSITKMGTGVLTLSSANTYTGGITISAGTLSLAGSGSISTGLALHSGAILSPGSSPGSLSAGSASLTLNGAALANAFPIVAVTVSNNIEFNSSSFKLGGLHPALGNNFDDQNRFRLFNASPEPVPNGLGISAVPEPSSFVLVFLGAVILVVRSIGSRTGFRMKSKL